MLYTGLKQNFKLLFTLLLCYKVVHTYTVRTISLLSSNEFHKLLALCVSCNAMKITNNLFSFTFTAKQSWLYLLQSCSLATQIIAMATKQVGIHFIQPSEGCGYYLRVATNQGHVRNMVY